MDGRDSSGRTISLLNSTAASNNRGDWKQFPHYHHRAPSCCATSPSLSPSAQTPPTLSRSSSSSDSRHLAPISPLTPSDPDQHLDSIFRAHKHPHQQYFLARPSQGKMDDPNASLYPPIPDATVAMTSAYPMPAQLAQQLPPQHVAPPQSVYRSSTSPSSEPSRVSTVSATSNAKSQSKKNSYPCPMAKQYGCTDFFTTSGHAARHAKKHTGKKDAFCPECNKAFTRKDNMEQHRRTHQNGRTPRAATATGSDDGKVKKTTKQPSAKKVKAEPQVFEAAVEQQLAEQPQPPPVMVSMPLTVPDPQTQPMAAMAQPLIDQSLMMPTTVGGPYFMNGPLVDVGPVPALPMAVPDMAARPPLHRTNFTNSVDYVPTAAPVGIVADPDSLHYSYPSPGLSNGLNSLALASEHRRLSEEKAQSASPQETPSTETPSKETETP